MEKDIALGSVGGIDLKLVGGKAVVSLTASETVLSGAIVLQASASGAVDAGIFIDLLFKEIEAKSPAGAAPIEETVKALIKNAVLAIA